MTTFFQRLINETTEERQQLIGVPVIQDALRGQIDLNQYLAFLGQAYHHVKHTVPLLMAFGSRLRPSQSWLQAPIGEYIEEEIGHEQWILNDIAASGGDTQAAAEQAPNFATDMMVAYAYHQIDRNNPIGFFGMVHVLEGTSIALADNAAHAMAGALSLGPDSFSYLRSHGSLDQAHTAFFETLMNRVVDADDQSAIISCAARFYELYGNVFRSLPAATQSQTSNRELSHA